MSRILQLRSIHQTPKTTAQCSVVLDTKFQEHYVKTRAKKLEERGFDPLCCSHFSSFQIDGKNYCTKHASSIALHILLEQQKGKSK